MRCEGKHGHTMSTPTLPSAFASGVLSFAKFHCGISKFTGFKAGSVRIAALAIPAIARSEKKREFMVKKAEEQRERGKQLLPTARSMVVQR